MFREQDIAVAANCVSKIYAEPELWADVAMPDPRAAIRIGVVSRDYAHKNLDLLPEIERILRQKHKLDVDFVVTLNDSEWRRRTAAFRSVIRNAGPLSVEQCPSFYRQLDGVIFPSLLECFSATPLEALVMGKPLFASDRPFVRDLCGEHPHYFDPLSPSDAARSIAAYFKSGGDPANLEAGRLHVLSMPTARDRAISYLRGIERILASHSIAGSP